MNISTEDLVAALRSLKLQTGSIDCSGCGREHNCSTGGCALIREAADQLERMNNFADNQVVDLLQRNGALLTAMTAISDAAIGYLEGGPYGRHEADERQGHGHDPLPQGQQPHGGQDERQPQGG